MKKQRTGSVFRKLYFLFVMTIAVIYTCTIIIFLSYAAAQRKAEISAMRAVVRQGAVTLREQLDIVADLEKNLISGQSFICFAHSIAATFLIRIPVTWMMSRTSAGSLLPMGLAAPAASLFSVAVCGIYTYKRK